MANLAEVRLAESAERLGALMQHMVDTWQINAMEFHDNFFTSEKVAGFGEALLQRGLKINWWGEADRHPCSSSATAPGGWT
ncbi:MAG: hypothetical protein U0Z44_06755 [Kouleothrix sp.]